MTKVKIKWCREGADNYEDLYLIPLREGVDAEGFNAEADLDVDNAIAWIQIAYDRTRFYHGRGGEGTSRPDAYVAYVRDGQRDRLVTEGATAVAHVGPIFSDKAVKAFYSLRAAKQAIKVELAKRASQTQTAEVQS